MSSRVLAIVAIILSVVALLLQIVGVALPFWHYEGLGYFGLWRGCRGLTFCGSYELPDGYLKSTRAMEMLALLSMVLVIVCLSIKTCCLKDKNILLYIAIRAAVAAGVLAMVGIIVYGSFFDVRQPGDIVPSLGGVLDSAVDAIGKGITGFSDAASRIVGRHKRQLLDFPTLGGGFYMCATAAILNFVVSALIAKMRTEKNE